MTNEFRSLDRQPPNPTYRHDVFKLVERPTVGYPSANLTFWSSEYRGYQISRESEQNTFYVVKTLDGSPTPIRLRGSFTGKTRAEQKIDEYLALVSREFEGTKQ
jgi:hypothetical protein